MKGMCEYKECTSEGYAFCRRLGFDYQVNEYMNSLPKSKPVWCPIHKVIEKDKKCCFPDEFQ